MSLLCLATATAVVQIATSSFTLAWTHSIEKVRWEEDYRIEGDRLHLVEARIKGSAAGMEPPPGARLKDGWWHYVPAQPWHLELRLTRSTYAHDYDLCTQGRCRSLAEIAPQDEGVTRVYPCSRGPSKTK
jgi:hypothetical protein